LWGNWLRDLRTEQFRCIYEQAIYPKNLGMEKHPGRHADHDKIRRQVMETLLDRGTFRKPALEKAEARLPEEMPAD
jgi:hypothetical protein